METLWFALFEAFCIAILIAIGVIKHELKKEELETINRKAEVYKTIAEESIMNAMSQDE